MKLNLKEVPELKPNPVFDGLLESLKDPKNFKKTEKKLNDILKVKHKHKTLASYVKCSMCQAKRLERQKLMIDLGFKNIPQFMEWRRVMNIINKKQSFKLK
jgi:excinuclease UvrABC ATPase subunit